MTAPTLYARVREAFDLARERRMPVAAATRELGISARQFYATVSQHPELNGVWARLKDEKRHAALMNSGQYGRRCYGASCPNPRGADRDFCPQHRALITAFWKGLREDLREGRIQ